MHAAIYKHDLLVLVSSVFFAFLLAVASDVLGLLFMCEEQLPRDLLSSSFFFFLFPQLSSSSHSLPTSFMLLCVNPAIFQTIQMFHSPMTFLWNFSELCGQKKLGDQLSGSYYWHTGAYPDTGLNCQENSLNPVDHSGSLLFCHEFDATWILLSWETWEALTCVYTCLKMSLKIHDLENSDRWHRSWLCSWMCLSLLNPWCLLHFSFPVYITCFQPFDWYKYV